MEPAGLSSRYGARRLCDSDVGAVYRLSAGNPIFYKYCPPCVTLESIREDMKVLPPGKSGEDKFYVGFFDGSMLTAVMDLILKYPNDETAFIGLFMVDSASQGKGTGPAIIEECLCFLKRQGLRRARQAGLCQRKLPKRGILDQEWFCAHRRGSEQRKLYGCGDGKGAVTRAKTGGYKKTERTAGKWKNKIGDVSYIPDFQFKADRRSFRPVRRSRGRPGRSLIV